MILRQGKSWGYAWYCSMMVLSERNGAKRLDRLANLIITGTL